MSGVVDGIGILYLFLYYIIMWSYYYILTSPITATTVIVAINNDNNFILERESFGQDIDNWDAIHIAYPEKYKAHHLAPLPHC